MPGLLFVDLRGNLLPRKLQLLLRRLRRRALLVAVRPDGALVLRLRSAAVAVLGPLRALQVLFLACND